MIEYAFWISLAVIANAFAFTWGAISDKVDLTNMANALARRDREREHVERRLWAVKHEFWALLDALDYKVIEVPPAGGNLKAVPRTATKKRSK